MTPLLPLPSTDCCELDIVAASSAVDTAPGIVSAVVPVPGVAYARAVVGVLVPVLVSPTVGVPVSIPNVAGNVGDVSSAGDASCWEDKSNSALADILRAVVPAAAAATMAAAVKVSAALPLLPPPPSPPLLYPSSLSAKPVRCYLSRDLCLCPQH